MERMWKGISIASSIPIENDADGEAATALPLALTAAFMAVIISNVRKEVEVHS
jgi:hypothetical protein